VSFLEALLSFQIRPQVIAGTPEISTTKSVFHAILEGMSSNCTFRS
jgi:hypothetical protein